MTNDNEMSYAMVVDELREAVSSKKYHKARHLANVAWKKGSGFKPQHMTPAEELYSNVRKYVIQPFEQKSEVERKRRETIITDDLVTKARIDTKGLRDYQTIYNGILNSLCGDTPKGTLRNYLEAFGRLTNIIQFTTLPDEQLVKVALMLLDISPEKYEEIKYDPIRFYREVFQAPPKERPIGVWMGNEFRVVDCLVDYSKGEAVSKDFVLRDKRIDADHIESKITFINAHGRWVVNPAWKSGDYEWAKSLSPYSLKAVVISEHDRSMPDEIVEVEYQGEEYYMYLSKHPIAYCYYNGTNSYYLTTINVEKYPSGQWHTNTGRNEIILPFSLPKSISEGDLVHIHKYLSYSERDIYRVEKYIVKDGIHQAVLTKLQYSIHQSCSKKTVIVPAFFLAKCEVPKHA